MKKILVIVGLLGLTTLANAAMTVSLDSTTPDAQGTRFNYSLSYSTGDSFKSGDFFVVTDFAGLVDGTNTQPAGWSFSAANLGPLPSPGVDNAAIPNLVWAYGGTPAVSPSPISGFSAVSLYSRQATGGFASGNWVFGTQGSGGSVKVPESVGVDVQLAIPEPATMGLMGTALLGLGLLVRRRK